MMTCDCNECVSGCYKRTKKFSWFCELLQRSMANNSEGSNVDIAHCDLYIRKVEA